MPPSHLALIITLIGFLLRLVHLGAHSYWFDEGLEIERALTAWPQVVWLVAGPDPPVYRLVIAALARLSTAEVWLRLPSALLGAGAIYLMYVWGSELGGSRVGLVGASLLAIHPVAVYYSQEVSQYSAVIFLSLALLLTFERVGRRNRAADWLLMTGVTIISLYTYYGLAWLVLVLEGRLLLQSARRGDKQRWGWLGAHYALLLAAVILLAVAFAIPQYAYQSQLRDAQPNAPQGRDLWESAILHVGQAVWERILGFQTTGYSHAPDFITAGLTVLILIGGLAAWRAGRPYRSLIGVALTLMLVLYISEPAGLFYFGTRYGVSLLPLLMLALALGLIFLYRLRRGVGVAAGIGVLCVFVAYSPNLRLLPAPGLDIPREELRSIIRYVHSRAEPDDAIYVYYGAVPVYRIYQPSPAHLTVFGNWFRDWPLEAKLAEIRQTTAGHARVWLVLSHIYPGEDAELLAGLQAAPAMFVAQDEYRLQNALAVLLQRTE